jgi:hypothetical protein
MNDELNIAPGYFRVNHFRLRSQCFDGCLWKWESRFAGGAFRHGDKECKAQGKSRQIAVCASFSPYQNLAKGLIP